MASEYIRWYISVGIFVQISVKGVQEGVSTDLGNDIESESTKSSLIIKQKRLQCEGESFAIV